MLGRKTMTAIENMRKRVEETLKDRGQVGIGTLIVFIAMVLVAAIAAGVLINTAGFLQTKSEQTGEQASAEISNRINVVSAYGTTPDGDSNVVKEVKLTVMRAAGADNINLDRATVEWIGPDKAVTLTSAGGYTDSTVTSSDEFAFTQIKGSTTVLTQNEDRVQLILDASKISGTSGLDEGEEVKLKLTTQYGAVTTFYVSVPESLDGKDTVQL